MTRKAADWPKLKACAASDCLPSSSPPGKKDLSLRSVTFSTSWSIEETSACPHGPDRIWFDKLANEFHEVIRTEEKATPCRDCGKAILLLCLAASRCWRGNIR